MFFCLFVCLHLSLIWSFQAAKLDPNLGCAFRHLGHYYREVANDNGRAQGCYKKAFQLSSDDVESGAAAVDLSMGQGDMVREKPQFSNNQLCSLLFACVGNKILYFFVCFGSSMIFLFYSCFHLP